VEIVDKNYLVIPGPCRNPDVLCQPAKERDRGVRKEWRGRRLLVLFASKERPKGKVVLTLVSITSFFFSFSFKILINLYYTYHYLHQGA